MTIGAVLRWSYFRMKAIKIFIFVCYFDKTDSGELKQQRETLFIPL